MTNNDGLADFIEEALTTSEQVRDSIGYYARRRKTFQDRADEETQRLRDVVEAGYSVHGMTETELAKLAGVTRATVRSWLGK